MIDGNGVTQGVVDALLQRLDALAAKLGVTAQYIYGVYVAQARVEAVRDTLCAVCWLVLSVLLGYFACYRLVKWARLDHESSDETWPYVCGGLAGF